VIFPSLVVEDFGIIASRWSSTIYICDQFWCVVNTVRNFAWSCKAKADYTTAKVKWESFTFPFSMRMFSFLLLCQ
jgi:hypothetical protein